MILPGTATFSISLPIGSGSITTSVAIFGPVTGPRIVGVLFINSNISGGPNSGKGAREVLEKAYNDALKRIPDQPANKDPWGNVR